MILSAEYEVRGITHWDAPSAPDSHFTVRFELVPSNTEIDENSQYWPNFLIRLPKDKAREIRVGDRYTVMMEKNDA